MRAKKNQINPLSQLLASVRKKAQTPRIYVLAGTNGAGKSSIAGAMLIEEGVEYFNPDEAAELIRVRILVSHSRNHSEDRNTSCPCSG